MFYSLRLKRQNASSRPFHFAPFNPYYYSERILTVKITWWILLITFLLSVAPKSRNLPASLPFQAFKFKADFVKLFRLQRSCDYCNETRIIHFTLHRLRALTVPTRLSLPVQNSVSYELLMRWVKKQLWMKESAWNNIIMTRYSFSDVNIHFRAFPVAPRAESTPATVVYNIMTLTAHFGFVLLFGYKINTQAHSSLSLNATILLLNQWLRAFSPLIECHDTFKLIKTSNSGWARVMVSSRPTLAPTKLLKSPVSEYVLHFSIIILLYSLFV